MATTRIQIRNHGPIAIEGDFEIVDADGNVFGLGGRSKVTLCRCGQSSTKPFCDGTHKTCDFEALSIARELPPPAPKPEPATETPKS